MERAAQQQAGEVAQLHRTIATKANMLAAQTTLQEAQWPGMTMLPETTEEKWDA
jgi:hypothetical protein